MVGKILEPEIRSLIEARNFAALRELFREWPPADVAEVILDLPDDDAAPQSDRERPGPGCVRLIRLFHFVGRQGSVIEREIDV